MLCCLPSSGLSVGFYINIQRGASLYRFDSKKKNCTDLRSEDGDDGDEEMVEAARRQRRRRRPRPHGHPRYVLSCPPPISPRPSCARVPATADSLNPLSLLLARRFDLHAEQEELVRSLEQKQAHHSRRWRVRATAKSRAIRLRVWTSCDRGRFDSIRFGAHARSLFLACAACLCRIPPRLRGLPRLLQLPPCLVSLGAGWLLVAVF